MKHKALRPGDTPGRSVAKQRRDRRRTYQTIPVWVARVTEHVYANGVHRINVVTRGGKVRTLRMKS
jgi:hypothetical protein